MTKKEIKTVEHPDLQQSKEELGLLFSPIPFNQLIAENPEMRPFVIDGLLRKGETMNVIAAAKTGKSFLVGQLAWHVATGTPWMQHPIPKGRVLIVDNELHPETLANRLDHIANSMMISPSDRTESIDAITLRGVGVDIDNLGSRLNITPGTYSLVILDALYRFIPKGTSENDNSEMTQVYNRLDQYAKDWDCAVAVVHHASKGSQGDKAVTDVGSGAGAISRATDTHVILRQHEQAELAVMEFSCRSMKSPEKISVKYDYPLWTAIAAVPEVRKSKSDSEQAAKDAEAIKSILESIPDGRAIHERALREATGFGQQRLQRLLAKLIKSGQVTKAKRRKKGQNQSFITYSKVQAGLEAGLNQQ